MSGGADEEPTITWLEAKALPKGSGPFTVSLHSWEDHIEYLISGGYTDDEIVDAFDQDEARENRAGEHLYWSSLHDRRMIEALLGRLRPPAHGVAPAATAARLPAGRPRLTDGSVRADLGRALAKLKADLAITRPSWEQLAGAHYGLGWDGGMSVDGLRKRRKRHPIPFREMVPHLTTE